MEPNKKNIRKWVKALRSGKFRQTRNILKAEGYHRSYYCCLGVACKVAKDNGLDIDLKEIFEYQYALPLKVRKWFGFSSDNPTLRLDKNNRKIIDKIKKEYKVIRKNYNAVKLNDGARLNFKEIADCVEYTYLRDK